MFDTMTQKSGVLAGTSNMGASLVTKQTNSNSAIDIKRKARERQYEKIKEYAIKYNVDEAMIYALLSEYKSMQKVPMDDANLPKNDKKQQSLEALHKSPMKKKKHQNLAGQNLNKKQLDNDLLIVEAPS